MGAFLRLSLIGILLVLPMAMQVDIRHNWKYELGTIPGTYLIVDATCMNIAPGECCKTELANFHYAIHIVESKTTVGPLLADQFSAAWSADAATISSTKSIFTNCTGLPIDRFFGPGTWERRAEDRSEFQYDNWPDENLAFGASWVDLRLRFPASSAGTRYLQFQGVKGLVWGTNTWSAASNGMPFPKSMKRNRLNGLAQQGTAYIQPPSRWRYPDVYEVNGTTYKDTGNGVYKSEAGRVLNLTNLQA